MPLGQLFTSLTTVRETIGNPIRERIEFPNNLYNGTPFLNIFDWAFNITSDLKEYNKLDEELSGVETTSHHYNTSTPKHPDISDANTLSIMWYLASFGTLVMFFLLISFSEVCCKKSMTLPPDDGPEVSPPPYDLFAPPTYASLYEEKKEEKNSKGKKKRTCEVFVINVLADKNSSRVPHSGTAAEGRGRPR